MDQDESFYGQQAPRSTASIPDYLAEHGTLPLPERACISRNTVMANGQVDLGWHISTIDHGDYERPLLIETWAEQGNITCQTIFLSRIGLEDMTAQDMLSRFRASEAIVCRDDTPINLLRIEDRNQHPLWSFTLVIGVDDILYVTRSFPLQPYPIIER